jgi:chromosome segregation ATPase
VRRGVSVLSLITQLEARSEQTDAMTYSLEQASRITEKSVATLRRAIKAGHLKASKDERQAYQLDHAALEAWTGRPLTSPSADLASELEAVRRELDAKQIEIGHLRELLEVQADALTKADREAERSALNEQTFRAAMAAFTRQLEALPAGRPPRRWLRRPKTAD